MYIPPLFPYPPLAKKINTNRTDNLLVFHVKAYDEGNINLTMYITAP